MNTINKKGLNYDPESLNYFKTENLLLKKIKLLELPIPKKIPGHIVIWIDPHI